MRVLLTVIDANLVGGQRVALAIAKKLRVEGHEVLAAFPGTGPLQAAFEQASIPWTSIPSWRIRDPRGYVVLHRVARKFHPDLIYSHCSTGGELISTVLAKLIGVPIVIHRHAGPEFGFGRVHQSAVKILSRWMYASCAKVIAVSMATREAILRLGTAPEKVEPILNGISPQDLVASAGGRARVRAELGLPEKACVVLLMARLCEQKGQRLLLEAAKMLPVKDLGLSLLLVGKDQEGQGQYEAYLRRMARECGLSDCVVFAGHRDDVADIYAASDIAVLPSTADSCPIAVLEAMAAKVPVVATATTGACELLEAGISGLIVPLDRADLLAEALRRLAVDPSLRERLAASAYARVTAQFSQEIFFQNALAVLDEARNRCRN